MSDVIDGRHLRRQQNRQAIVEALCELYEEGRYDATAAEVSERAGLSPRSLFRYFDDTDDLARAAIEHQQALARPLLRIGATPDDDLGTRIAAVVRARLDLWAHVAPGARAARMRAPISEAVAVELRQARSFLRHQLAELFAAEIAERGEHVLAAADVLCSFESVELLLHDHRLSRRRTAALLTESLRALLAPPGGCC